MALEPPTGNWLLHLNKLVTKTLLEQFKKWLVSITIVSSTYALSLWFIRLTSSPNMVLFCLIVGIVPITTSEQIATVSVQPQGGDATAKGELKWPLNSMLYTCKPNHNLASWPSSLFARTKRGGTSSLKLPYHCFSECEWSCVYMTLCCADATASGSSHQPHQNPSASSSSIPELGE